MVKPQAVALIVIVALVASCGGRDAASVEATVQRVETVFREEGFELADSNLFDESDAVRALFAATGPDSSGATVLFVAVCRDAESAKIYASPAASPLEEATVSRHGNIVLYLSSDASSRETQAALRALSRL